MGETVDGRKIQTPAHAHLIRYLCPAPQISMLVKLAASSGGLIYFVQTVGFGGVAAPTLKSGVGGARGCHGVWFFVHLLPEEGEQWVAKQLSP